MKKLLIVLILSCFVSVSWAQSFFKPLPKTSQSGQLVSVDSSQLFQPKIVSVSKQVWMIRPVTLPITYTLPGNQALAGLGVSYQLLSQDPGTGDYSSTITIAFPIYLGTSLSGSQTIAKGIGLSVGFLNNLLFVGGLYDGEKLSGAASIGVSLN